MGSRGRGNEEPLMSVHPAPRKRNIALRCDDSSSHSAAAAAGGAQRKKLRRLPHIFSNVLELPLGSDADVSVEEGPNGFRFVAATDDLWDDVRAHAIEIYPGVMKVVVRDASGGGGGGEGAEEEELELYLDQWRFRLPPSTLPALATATYANGELVVTIPKAAEEGIGEDGGILGGGGRRGGFRNRLYLMVVG